MKKIILNVDDKNLSVVLNILENLKHGLIKDLSVQSDLNKSKEVYSSKNEDTHNKNKYSTSSAYKKKLYKNEDTKTSTGRYLNKEDFRKKLKAK
ncbi:MAG: hypothetical protein MJK08_02125 [Campylobacterales bacterium]|nr:hypothetical protein [Campylobacterales bacterium]